MKTTTKTITPEEARRLLLKNNGNRGLTKGRVDKFVKIINAGEWRLTHQGICISKTGRLIDGQHRLQACVKSQTPIEVLVTVDADDDLFKFIDIGKVRSNSDLFKIDGYSHHSHFASLATKVYNWSAKAWIHSGVKSYNYTIDDLLSIGAAHKDDFIEIFKTFERREYKQRFIAPQHAHFLYYILNRIDYHLVETYLLPFISGRTIDQYLINFRNELIDAKIKRTPLGIDYITHKMLHTIKCSLDSKNYRMKHGLEEMYDTYDSVKIKVNPPKS